MSSGPLPSFRNPPVMETVLAVQFVPIPGWDIRHVGLFSQSIGDEFRGFEVHPPLESKIETFDAPSGEAQPRTQFQTGAPEVRCWFLTENGQQILQIQRDRLIFNWKRMSVDTEYPKYENFVRPSFEKYWDKYVSFLYEQELSQPEIVQCEVTYVNHFLKGEGWENLKDWNNVFSFLRFPYDTSFLPDPETAHIDLAYLIPNEQGRLRSKINRAVRNTDSKEIIAVNLTARGRPDSSNKDGIIKWFEIGHEWVVRGFFDLTSEKMHNLWGYET